jgi:hypothetical protein
LEVTWRSGSRSVVSGVKASRVYQIDEAGAMGGQSPKSSVPSSERSPSFENVSALFNRAR